MDYLKMILTGYTENREYLTEYFIREQKKAEKEFIDANEFFGKSKKVIQSFYENIDNRMGKRKNELYFMLDRAKNKASTFSGDFNPKLSYDELCQERNEYCQSELEKISRANYTVHISKSYFIGNLWNREIEYIEKVLKLAEKILNEPDEEPQPKSEKQKENTLWFKTGLLFAKGEMEKYYSANGKAMRSDYTAGKIADEVGFPKGEKYILGTLQGYKSDKDIYNSRDKMLFILEHCKNEGIEPHQSFLEKLPPETI